MPHYLSICLAQQIPLPFISYWVDMVNIIFISMEIIEGFLEYTICISHFGL